MSLISQYNARLRGRWEALKAEHSTPGRLGVAVGVGVFAGCSPVHGFQFLLALGLALLLRLNKLAVMLGLQVSIPPLNLLIIYLGLQTGERMLHGRWLPLRLGALRAAGGAHMVRTFLADFVVGSLALGTVLGLLAGIVTTLVLLRSASRTRSGEVGPV